MVLLILTLSIILIGLVAIALSQPPNPDIPVWNDETERRLLNERKITIGRW